MHYHIYVINTFFSLALIIFCLSFVTDLQGAKYPLHDAAKKGDIAEVERLLEITDVNAQDEYGWAPLHFAASNNNDSITKLLLSCGAQVNAQTKSNWTPLCVAAYKGRYNVTLALLQHGADLYMQSNALQGPLELARKHPKVENLLLAWPSIKSTMHIDFLVGSP